MLLPVVLLNEPGTWPRMAFCFVATVLNQFVINVPIMLFAVANLDSAAWGTRTSEVVDSEALDASGGGADPRWIRTQKYVILTVYFVANYLLTLYLSVWSWVSSVVSSHSRSRRAAV